MQWKANVIKMILPVTFHDPLKLLKLGLWWPRALSLIPFLQRIFKSRASRKFSQAREISRLKVCNKILLSSWSEVESSKEWTNLSGKLSNLLTDVDWSIGTLYYLISCYLYSWFLYSKYSIKMLLNSFRPYFRIQFIFDHACCAY